jgi:hypothetical protein
MVTENFGFGAGAYITGVVFSDTVKMDKFYDIGEGLGQVGVQATASDGRVFQTTTGPSGGYRLLVPSGSYSVIFTKDGKSSAEAKVVSVGSQNVKVDFSDTFVDTTALQLSVNVASFSENAGRNVAILTVTRQSVSLEQALHVQLVCDPTEIELPATIQIPANSASIQIPIHAVDDSLLDGTIRVQVLARSGLIISPPLEIQVFDAESIRLSASVSRFAENAGAGVSVLTVSRSNTDISQPVTVGLVSSDTSEATVPETVVIPAGYQSTTVGVSAIDDNLFDGTQVVRIDANAAGYVSSQVEIQVDDFQTLQIVLPYPFALIENDPDARQVQATIQLRSVAPSGGMAITVDLSPTGSTSIPGSVVVPAGQSRISFPIAVQPNTTQEGRRIVRVKAKMNPLEESLNFVVLDSIFDRWHNKALQWDVDGNGSIDPLDVLVAINELNANGSRRLDNTRLIDRSLFFVDTNDDGFIDPLDVLGIINFINTR